MQQIINAMQAAAERVASGKMFTRIGNVSSYDATNYCAKVLIQPEGLETGWIPVASQWIGNGWGLFAPPDIDDLVEVQFQEGDLHTGIVCGRLYTDIERPLPCPIGEFWLVHQSGSYLKLLNNGNITLHSTAEIDVGNLGGTLHNLVTDAFVALFNGHTHTSSSPGSPTSAPNHTMGASHLTSILKAN